MDITFYVADVDTANSVEINCLTVTAVRNTMDMSVSNSISKTEFYPYREIEQIVGKEISLMGKFPSFFVENLTENEVIINWCGTRYPVKIGEDIKSKEYAVDNPRLSWEGILLKMKYEKLNVWERIISSSSDVIQLHLERPVRASNSAEIKQDTLKLLYEEILRGETGLRPMYAWLSAATDWNTLIISDYSKFAECLGEFLSIDDRRLEAWIGSFKQLLKQNKLEDIFSAVPGLKNHLEQLAEQGLKSAMEILSKDEE